MTATATASNVSPRGRLALSSIYVDSVAARRAEGADHVYKAVFDNKEQTVPLNAVINKFWDNPNNKDVVDAFMNNRLCIDAAQGKQDALDAYKKYAVQDYFYLLDWFKFMLLRLTTLPHDDFNLVEFVEELESISGSLSDQVLSWFLQCTRPKGNNDGLGIPVEDFFVERTVGEIAYGQFLQNNARQDDWYNLHIILIGCYWGWAKLAAQLYNDPKTQKDTIFYDSWIKLNVGDIVDGKATMADWANALSLFLDDNAKAYASTITEEQAQELFRTALRLEVGLFNSAYETPMKRPNIVSNLPPALPGLPELPGSRQGPQSRSAWRKLIGLQSEGEEGDVEAGKK